MGSAAATIDRAGYRKTAWGVDAMLALALAWTAFQGNWDAAGASLVFVVIATWFIAQGRWYSTLIHLLVILAAAMNVGGYGWNLFTRVPFYDEFVHGFTTFIATVVVTLRVYRPVLSALDRHRAVFAFTGIATGLALGAGWEIVEWIGYQTFQGQMASLRDTVVDLIVDLAGAVVAVHLIFATARMRLHERQG